MSFIISSPVQGTLAPTPVSQLTKLSLSQLYAEPIMMSRSSSSATLVDSVAPPPSVLEKDIPSTCPSPIEAVDIRICQDCALPITPPPVNVEDPFIQVNVPTLTAKPDLSMPTVLNPIKAILKTSLTQLDRPIKIVGLLATADTGCRMYAEMTSKSCRSMGVEFVKLDLLEDTPQQEGNLVTFDKVKTALMEINQDLEVDGLIVYFPLFGIEKDDELRRLISPRIDVEGVHASNLAHSASLPAPSISELELIAKGDDRTVVYPCTPLAVIRVLQSLKGVYNFTSRLGGRLQGKIVTVINRSETVGRPLAAMLANEGALVYSVDISSTQTYHRHESQTFRPFCIQTSTLSRDEILRTSDVIISAVPGDRYKIPTKALKQGVICVDLSEKGNFEEDVRDKTGVWAPRVGSVTILNLQNNALILRRRSEHEQGSQ